MTQLHNLFKTTRLSIWLLLCALILAATSVYAAGDQRPLAAVDILGSPDAAVDGKFAVGTTTPGNKTLTVAGVIDFVGAGTVHNYFTQGPGNNMQIRSNVDEYNAVGNGSYAQWNMVMGASLDVFSIRRSPASSTYNEDALFWIDGATGDVGIAKVDTSNGATIPFTLQAHLHVQTDIGNAIRGVVTGTAGSNYGVHGQIDGSFGAGVYGYASATEGSPAGVYGESDATSGRGVYGVASATSGSTYGVLGESSGTIGHGVHGEADATSGTTYGVSGLSESSSGTGVQGWAQATSGVTYGVKGLADSNSGRGVYGSASATTGTTYGVYGRTDSISGIGVYGRAAANSGTTYGVYGDVDSPNGRAVYGTATAAFGTTYGVYGNSDSTSGYGVYGSNSATSGATYGVYGMSNSTGGEGVYGLAAAASGTTSGVHGQSISPNGRGVYGRSTSTSGTNYGIYGQSDGGQGRGVYGFAARTSGNNYGVYGESASTNGQGVFGYATASSGPTIGVQGFSNSTDGVGVAGISLTTTGYNTGVYGSSNSVLGIGVQGSVPVTSGTNYGVYGNSSSASGYDFYAGGAGTDYGPFTGAHEVLLSESFPKELKLGMIVSATGDSQIRQLADGSVDFSSTLPTVRLASSAEDPAVLGVLVAEVTLPQDHWYTPVDGERFGTVNALGEGRVWVTNINGDITAGDYITTSAVPGYGQRQDDGYLHNYTLAKALDTVDWDSVTETVTIDGKVYKVYLLAVVYTSG